MAASTTSHRRSAPERQRFSQKKTFGLAEQLGVEAAHKPLVELLFLLYGVKDISSLLAERKSGSDFLLFIPEIDVEGWRCENKFEQYASGRQLYELVSTDRPLNAGWFFTSRAAWLLSWYPSAELVALPMDAARKLLLDVSPGVDGSQVRVRNPGAHQSTSARNNTYLSWNLLPDIDWVVRNVEQARVLDLHREMGMIPVKPAMLRGKSPEKHCTVDELVTLIRQAPKESAPVPVTPEELKAMVNAIAARDRKRVENADRRQTLSWLERP
jgi:hypothetical protein